MENLIVKFGTQKPIGFREYDKDHPQMTEGYTAAKKRSFQKHVRSP